VLSIAFISSVFCAYRLMLWWMGAEKPCSCMGTITDNLPFSLKFWENLMSIVLLYLVAGSYSLLLGIKPQAVTSTQS